MDWIPGDEEGYKRRPDPNVIALLIVLVVVLAFAVVGYGFIGLHWFSSKNAHPLTQSATETATQAPQSTVSLADTTGTATSTPRAGIPTATPTPRAGVPTATSGPAATATPASPPPQLWVHQIVLAPKNCVQVANGWSCSDTLGNFGSANLQWTASSNMAQVVFSPSSGTITPGQQIQVNITIPCVPSGYLYFTGPANQVAVSWGCYANS